MKIAKSIPVDEKGHFKMAEKAESITFDMTAPRIVRVDEMPFGGNIGQITISRLVSEVLVRAGELKQGEEVTHIQFTENGWIRFRTEGQI